MLRDYIKQGVLQSNQLKTAQTLPNKESQNSSGLPDDGLAPGRVIGDDTIFKLKNFSMDIKDKGSEEEAIGDKKSNKAEAQEKENKQIEDAGNNIEHAPLRKFENSGGLICEQGKIQSMTVDVSLGANREDDLTPNFLTGNEGESPCAEAAILTAQTIIEKDLVEKGKDKYTDLKKCPSSSKVISAIEGFDNTQADIVIENAPLLMSVQE